MKQCLIALLLAGPAVTGFAARATIDTISNDPYTSAIVVDGATGTTLFEDHADTPVYPASMVKLMDLLLIMERIEAGTLHLEDRVNVSAEAAGMGGSQVYLEKGEIFTVDELLYALVVKSANDAAVALAEHVAGSKEAFVQLMNQRALALGMTDTSFASVHGLPPGEGQKPDVSTARDMARLSRAVTRFPRALHYTSTLEKWFRNNSFQMLSHNRLLKDMEGCDGLKTGYFTAAGFSVGATVVQNERRVFAMVMGCASRPTRDLKAVELLRLGFAKLPALPAPPPTVSAPPPGETVPETTGAETEAEPSGTRLGWLVILLVILAAAGTVVYRLRRSRNRAALPR